MRKLRLLLASLGALGLMVTPAIASADVNNFTVTDFTANETLTRSDPQGELHVVEHIAVNFTDSNHGILRAIPSRYKGHSLQLRINSVTSDRGTPSQFTTYGSNGNTVLKIGDPNQTVTGAQEYTVDYTLRNVISFYKDHDELYWDVNGDQWQQPFDHVAVTVHLPKTLEPTQMPICYAGSFGSREQHCSVTNASNSFSVITTQPLAARQTLTYVAGFGKGYFTPAKWYETYEQYLGPAIKFLVPAVAIGGGALLLWFRKGRDPKGAGTIVAQYDAPDDLKAMEVGTISDFKVDGVDITATIVDLAIRGYLKIIEAKQHHLIGKDKLSYSLQQVNADYAALNPNEVLIMKALFDGSQPGTAVDLSALKNKLYATAKLLNKQVEADLTTRDYFRINPLTAGRTLGLVATIAFIVLLVGSTLFGIPVVAGLIVGTVVAYICSTQMSARSSKGVAALEHIKGLKLYLNVAEKDRLEKLQAPDAAYAANAAEPLKTVDLFEKLLPYAMVLGVEKQWGEQFKSLYTSPPDWYSGNWTTFNAYYLASNLNAGIGSAVNSAFSSPSSSGGSGFSGGSSGGGGGGGGGGGW